LLSGQYGLPPVFSKSTVWSLPADEWPADEIVLVGLEVRLARICALFGRQQRAAFVGAKGWMDFAAVARSRKKHFGCRDCSGKSDPAGTSHEELVCSDGFVRH